MELIGIIEQQMGKIRQRISVFIDHRTGLVSLRYETREQDGRTWTQKHEMEMSPGFACGLSSDLRTAVNRFPDDEV